MTKSDDRLIRKMVAFEKEEPGTGVPTLAKKAADWARLKEPEHQRARWRLDKKYRRLEAAGELPSGDADEEALVGSLSELYERVPREEAERRRKRAELEAHLLELEVELPDGHSECRNLRDRLQDELSTLKRKLDSEWNQTRYRIHHAHADARAEGIAELKKMLSRREWLEQVVPLLYDRCEIG